MSGYAQVTVRRNRDGTVVIITESTDVDPHYCQFDPEDMFDARRIAKCALEHVVGVDP